MKSHFDISPGVECFLEDTTDGLGVRIKIAGAFRHDQLTHEEIVERLTICFRDLDLDADSE